MPPPPGKPAKPPPLKAVAALPATPLLDPPARGAASRRVGGRATFYSPAEASDAGLPASRVTKPTLPAIAPPAEPLIDPPDRGAPSPNVPPPPWKPTPPPALLAVASISAVETMPPLAPPARGAASRRLATNEVENGPENATEIGMLVSGPPRVEALPRSLQRPLLQPVSEPEGLPWLLNVLGGLFGPICAESPSQAALCTSAPRTAATTASAPVMIAEETVVEANPTHVQQSTVLRDGSTAEALPMTSLAIDTAADSAISTADDTAADLVTLAFAPETQVSPQGAPASALKLPMHILHEERERSERCPSALSHVTPSVQSAKCWKTPGANTPFTRGHVRCVTDRFMSRSSSYFGWSRSRGGEGSARADSKREPPPSPMNHTARVGQASFRRRQQIIDEVTRTSALQVSCDSTMTNAATRPPVSMIPTVGTPLRPSYVITASPPSSPEPGSSSPQRRSPSVPRSSPHMMPTPAVAVSPVPLLNIPAPSTSGPTGSNVATCLGTDSFEGAEALEA